MKKTPTPIRFDWDEGNIEKNWEKHGVHQKEAEEVFTNKPIKIYVDIKHSQAEERFVALGKSNLSRKLYLVFTVRNEQIRIISARNQSNKERKFYEEK